jgi:hypothetical protein
MEQLQTQMNQLVRSFTSQIAELARRAALQALQASLEKPERPPATITEAKRSTADIERLARRFVSFVEAHPGLRIEEINKQLGTSTRDLALPVRRLISARAIRTEGIKRARVYFAGQ